jgi:hypothetical protein
VPLTVSEEANIRAYCYSHEIPTHTQARIWQIAESVQEIPFQTLKAEALEA